MADSQPVAVAAPASSAKRGPLLLAGGIWLGALIVLAFIAAGVGVAVAPQLLGRSLGFIVDTALPLAAVAMISTLLLARGDVDLSIGGILALTSVTIGLLAPEMGVGLAAAVAVIVAIVVGFLNGLLVGVTRIHSAIITLGTLTLSRGIAFFLAEGQMLPIDDAAGLNAGVLNWIMLILALGIALALGFALSRSRASGSPASTDQSGLARVGESIALFTASGLIVGLAGVSLTGRIAVGTVTLGQGFEATAIAVALLGGVAFGRGVSVHTLLAIVGTLVAVAAFSIINAALTIVGGSGPVIEVFKGALILVGAIVAGAYQWLWGRFAQQRTAARS